MWCCFFELNQKHVKKFTTKLYSCTSSLCKVEQYYVQSCENTAVKRQAFASIHIAKYTSTLNGFILGTC